MSKILKLRAKIVSENALGSRRCHTQKFEKWDPSTSEWVDVWEYEDRVVGRIRGELERVDEVQLQPLVMIESSQKTLQGLCEKGVDGSQINRLFWKRSILWRLDKTRRLTWTMNGGEFNTTSEEGEWSDDDSTFESKGETSDLSGRCLAGLPIIFQNPEKFVYKLDYTSCAHCDFAGFQFLSLHGANISHAQFFGKYPELKEKTYHRDVTLNECDLSSTVCLNTMFNFIGKKAKDVFTKTYLDNAGYLHTAKFYMEKDDMSVISQVPDISPSLNISYYQNLKCCWKRYKVEQEGLGISYSSYSGFCGAKSYSFALIQDQEQLLRHKEELKFLVSELERLRKSKTTKDNWKDTIKAWIAIRDMKHETAAAISMKICLFGESSPNSIFVHELMIAANILHEIDGEPPRGLIGLVNEFPVLRSTEYLKEKNKLTSEIINIDLLIKIKAFYETLRGYLWLAVLFFVANFLSSFLAYESKSSHHKTNFYELVGITNTAYS